MKEKKLIGALLFKPKLITKISTLLKDSDFRTEGKAFEIIKAANLENRNLSDAISESGLYISDYLYSDIVSNQEIIQTAKEIKNISTAEKLKEVFTKYQETISSSNLKELLPEFQEKFYQITQIIRDEKTDIQNIIKDFESLQEEYEEKMKNGQQLIGISTGFSKLDEITEGIRPEHFIVIGGNTSSGKTFYAINLLVNILKQKKRAIFYSLEMSKIDIAGRILGVMTDMNSNAILKRALAEDNYKKALEAKAKLYDYKLAVYSQLHDIEDIIMSVMEESQREKVDVIFIDYLQLIGYRGMPKEYDVMRMVSTQLQDLCKRLKISIIALSQLSNEAIKSRNSELIGFKGAGNIAASADLAMELVPRDNPDVRKEKFAKGEDITIKLDIKKNRHGRVGWTDLSFTGATGIFKEL